MNESTSNRAILLAVIYKCVVWVAVAIPVAVAVYITGRIMPLWFLLLPASIYIKLNRNGEES